MSDEADAGSESETDERPPGTGEDEAGTDDAGAETVEKSFRGISQRLAVRYLKNVGGDHVAGDADGEGEDVVEGDGWTASVTSKTVNVAGSISLTEVTVVFEGEDLDPLVARFSQKAMRAGG